MKGGICMNKKSLNILALFVLLLSISLFFIFRANIWDSSKMVGGDSGKPIVEEPNQSDPDGTTDGNQTDGEGSGLDNSCENPSETIDISNNKYKGILDYPQVSNMSCKTAEIKINETIEKHIEASYNAYLQLEADEKEQRQFYEDKFGHPVPEEEEYMYNFEYDVTYEIKFNENNLLSILIYDHIYSGGAHGMTNVTSYNFNVINGQELHLEDIGVNLDKIKQYVVTELQNRPEVFTESLNKIEIDHDRPFYFSSNGIVIKFFESEIGPYAAGMPEVAVPSEVYE